jgi:ABC-2 type transport system permease protein
MFFSRWQDEAVKVWAFAYKNWIMTRRNLFTLFEVLFWPVVGFLSVGLLAEFTQLNAEMRAFILVGVISMGVLQVCQLDVSYALLYDVWSKALKHGFMAPVGIRHLLLGSLMVGAVRGALVLIALMVASLLLFDFNFLIPGTIPLILFALGLFLNAAMVGLLVCILVLFFGIHAEVAAWSLVSLMFLLCGIYYPVSILPRWVMIGAELIPLTYSLEYIRQFYGFEGTYSHVLFRGYVMVFIYLCIEILLMKRALHRAKKKGTLLKLSE